MAEPASPGSPSVEELDRLSTEDLRKRAFHKAERHGDVGFFWDLMKRLPSATDLDAEDGSAGALTGSISEAIDMVRELLGKDDLGDREPLVRARYIEYLRERK